MRISWVLVVVAVFCSSSGRVLGAGRTASTAQTNGNGNDQENGHVQTAADKLIEKHRVTLRKQGPESRTAREAAVNDLLRMDNPKAHAVLQEYVGPGEDSDRLRRHVLRRLHAVLRSEVDPVFATGTNRGRIRRSYVKRLVAHFDGKESETGVPRDLRDLARESLIAMGTRELKDVLELLLANNEIEVRMQALRAAGESQDLGLAPVLADHLASDGLRRVAQEALHDLTYTMFADKRAFDVWFPQNRHRQYVNLAEEAARDSRRRSANRLAAMSRRQIATVERLVSVLAEGTRKDKWKLIQSNVFADDPQGVMQACLRRLSHVLAGSAAAQTGTDAKDRKAFFDELVKQLAKDPEQADRALLLEVASYLCAAGEPAAIEHEKRLRAGLDHASRVVKLSALRGLRRFPSPVNRQAVMVVVNKARDTGAEDRVDLLGAALATLKSVGWQAPAPDDADRQTWMDGLHNALRDDSLSPDLRIRVIDVLCLSEANGQKLAQVFRLLKDELAREVQSREVRVAMMRRLLNLLPSVEGDARDAAAEQYLQQLLVLLVNQDAKIKREAAKLLQVPADLRPESGKKLGEAIIQHAGGRLLEETDDKVFEELVMVLRILARVDTHVAMVNRVLRDALPKRGGTDQLETRDVLVRRLLEIAVQPRQATAEWHETCRRLLAIQKRDDILLILLFYLKGTGPNWSSGIPEELAIKVWRLVLDTASLRPADPPWGGGADKKLTEEKIVVQAVKSLIAAEVFATDETLDSPGTRLTYLQCLAAVEDHATLKTAAKKWLDPADKKLTGVARHQARLLLAQALLATGDAAQAWSASGIQQVDGKLMPERLRITRDIAAKMEPRLALPVLEDLIERTPPDNGFYWRRFRLYLEVRHKLEPTQGRALRQELEQWVRAHGTELVKIEQRELEKLRATLSAGG